MLFLIGIGLADPSDITVKGLEIVKRVHKVFLEGYTSVLCQNANKDALEKFYGREIVILNREEVESDDNIIIKEASVNDTAFLVVGDPFGATTHSDLLLRAVNAGIPYRVVHNASIISAVACTGLQLYSFGETVSIPFWEENWKPESFFDKIINNLKGGLHTLCLLDIKVKEKSIEALMKGKDVYQDPRFMTASMAAQQLLAIIENRKNSSDSQHINESSFVVGLARVGSDDQNITSTTLKQLSEMDLGAPLHSLVIPGKMHPLEYQMFSFFRHE